MNELDIQVLKEALEVLDGQEGGHVQDAKTALGKIISLWLAQKEIDKNRREDARRA